MNRSFTTVVNKSFCLLVFLLENNAYGDDFPISSNYSTELFVSLLAKKLVLEGTKNDVQRTQHTWLLIEQRICFDDKAH